MRGRRFSPLDRKLRLRADHWSEGAARVATRQGLQAKSFDLAAEAYQDAVGGAMSGDSLRRVTEEWGQAVAARRSAEAEQANEPAARDASPQEQRVAAVEPITGQANISTDGAMVLIRDEGWKEVKLVAISAVQVQIAGARAVQEARPGRRTQDPLVTLTRHSYQAGLWDADTMGWYQYAEGLRRGLDRVPRLSSVNDGAAWIARITATNFPGIPQIVDWPHSSGKLWLVAKTVFGEGTLAAHAWANEHLDQLWQGQVAPVVAALEELDLRQERWPEEVQPAASYFETRQENMRYDQFRAAGYPIGSGTVESAANTVIHHRMKRPGRGWQRDNAQGMLAGLSELHSGRFEHAWQTILASAA